MKTLNKWLNKLFGLNLIKSVDLDSLRFEIQYLRNKIDSPLLGENDTDALRDAQQYEPIK